MFIRSALHTALFLGGLLSTAAWLRSLDTLPWWSFTRSRVHHAASQLTSHDTLFFGSSRFNFGLIPSEFDERMKELGLTTKAFNVSNSGTRTHDISELAQWFAAQRPSTIRHAIIELWDWDPGEVGTNWMTDIRIEAHTLRQLPHRLQSILLLNPTFGARAEKAYFALCHTAVNYLRIGQGPRLVEDWLLSTQGKPPLGAWPVQDGGWKDVVAIAWPATVAEHKAMVANPKPTDDILAHRLTQNVLPVLLPGWNDAAFDQMDRALRAAGIEPIYVTPPQLGNFFQGRGAIPELAKRAIVLDLDDPKAHPELFRRELWYDRSHMNREGAKFFSRYLAEQVHTALAKRPH